MIVKLNEYVSNLNLMKFITDNFYQKIKKKQPKAIIEINDNYWGSFEFVIYKCNEKMEEYIQTLFKMFLDNNFIIGYQRVYDTFYFIVKNIYTQRYFPKDFLYHTTRKSNLETIAKIGLELKSSKYSSEWNQIDLTYPPAIFATIPPTMWKGETIKINTKKLQNKWWFDLNMYYPDTKDMQHYVMTFEPISPEYLEFFVDDKYSGKWISASEFLIQNIN